MDYAIIKLGNKQHRVRDGETLVVDRLPTEEGKSFEPVVLLGEPKVTATVLAHGRGPKLLIGKYRKRTGYKRHNGFRAATSKVEITLGTGGARKAAPKPATRTAAPTRAVESTPPAAEVEAPAVEAVKATPVPESPAPAAAEAPAAGVALPAGYEGMTVAQIGAAAKDWGRPELEAALAHEQAGAARKGALAALESALAKEAG